jgi:hypothetical protein
MATYLDARVPVVFASLEDAGPLDAILVEGEAFHAAAHVPGCPCCPPRGAAGRALAALLQDRARGRIPFFTRVISISATEAGRAEIEAALQSDPVASACFRPA